MTDRTHAEPGDAFAHHPELRDRIRDPLQSYFRDFRVEALVQERPELSTFAAWALSDKAREQTRREILANRAHEDLWVFAYGSLMWDPAIDFVEVRRAFAEGVSRQFILLDDKGGRGNPEVPGLMAALDHGEGCEGLVFRIAAEAVETETERLWRREMVGPAYLPTFVTARLSDRKIRALTFMADHEADTICPDLTLEEQVRHLAHGAGFLGTSRDYLANIVSQFATLGVHDPKCAELLRAVDAYIATRDQTEMPD